MLPGNIKTYIDQMIFPAYRLNHEIHCYIFFYDYIILIILYGSFVYNDEFSINNTTVTSYLL